MICSLSIRYQLGGKPESDMNNLFVKAVLLPIACAPMLLRADIVFSNVTGTGTVSTGAPICGIASCSPNSTIAAEEFTPASKYILTGAQVLVDEVSGAPPSFDVFLDSNSSGVPGSEVEQIGSGLTATTAYPGSFITATATPITLVSGTPYWLVLAPATTSSLVNWMNGGSPAAPFENSSNGGLTWNPERTNTLQFQIDGNPVSAVPEPSSFAPLAGILTLLYGVRQRLAHRKFAL
jgi:hypothetical protein